MGDREIEDLLKSVAPTPATQPPPRGGRRPRPTTGTKAAATPLTGLSTKSQPNRMCIRLPLAEANTIRKLAGKYGYSRTQIVAWLIRRGFGALPKES